MLSSLCLVSLESLFISHFNDTPFVMIMQSWNVQYIRIWGKVKSEKLQNALLLSCSAFFFL